MSNKCKPRREWCVVCHRRRVLVLHGKCKFCRWEMEDWWKVRRKLGKREKGRV